MEKSVEEAMTPARKAELGEKAAKLYRMICNNDLILSDLTEALEHVEREVWKRVIEHYSHHVHNDLADYPDEFVEWCRTQAKETT